MEKVIITALSISEDKSLATYKANGIKVQDDLSWFGESESSEIGLFEELEQEDRNAETDKGFEWLGSSESAAPTYKDLTKEQVIELLQWSYQNHKSWFGFETVQDMIDEQSITAQEGSNAKRFSASVVANFQNTIKTFY